MPHAPSLNTASPTQSAQAASSTASGPNIAALLSASPDAILELDRDFRIVYANPQAIRISQLGPDGSIGKIYWDMRPAMRGTIVEENFLAVMRGRTPRKFELFHPMLRIWMDVLVTPCEDGIAVFYRDITAAKLTEQNRDAAAHRLQQAFDATPDAVLCLDRSWNFTFANWRAVDMLASGPLVGEHLWDLFPHNALEPFNSSYRKTMEQRIPTEFEAFYPEPLNTWYRCFARPFEDGIVIFFNDITHRKFAEERRDKVTRQLDQVFDVTTDAIMSLDCSWRFTFVNRRANEILQVKGGLLGKNIWEEFPAALDSDFHINYERTMCDRVATTFEAFYPEPLNLWFNILSLPSDDGIVVFFRDITKQRRDEAAIRESESRYRRLAELGPQLIYTSDSTGKINFANRRLLNYLSLSPEQLLEDGGLTAIHPDDRQNVYDSWARSFATGGEYSVELRLLHAKTQEYRWFLTRGVPIRDEDGNIESWLGVATDINEQKTAAVALAISEARYRVLADLNPQAIWMGDAAGNITYANHGFIDYLGFTTADLDNWITAFHPEDQTRVLDNWARSVSTGTEYDIEARIIRAHDRAARWWWVHAQPVRDTSGNILHWLGVAIDIDDRKNFAETLLQKQIETERQRAELETIYDTAPVGLALFDPVEFRYLRVNDHQASIIGLPKDKILGRRITEIAPLKGLKELFQQVAAGGAVRNHILEGELPTRPGLHRFWNVNYSPVYSIGGKVEAIAAVILEITHQKKAESALIQSEKLAAVGRLASSISHEINNPLEAITNLLYLIALSDELPPSVKSYVQTAQSELSRVCQIATQTLRFHRQAVRATNVTAADLVDAVLNLYQGRLANSNIKVEATYASQTRILCFENDIRQVLNNLIANAIDAMRQGGRLVVRAHDATDNSEGYPADRKGIRITIADTGHGMSAEVRARLFEPFYTTKDLNGTGLGLWISSGIVKRHQGRLTFRSSQHPVHHGTIFSLFLPRAEAPSPPSQ
ncbi:MAG: PAS domain-containing protein [Edaphobacter sp.]